MTPWLLTLIPFTVIIGCAAYWIWCDIRDRSELWPIVADQLRGWLTEPKPNLQSRLEPICHVRLVRLEELGEPDGLLEINRQGEVYVLPYWEPKGD